LRDLEWFVPVSAVLGIELLLWWLAFYGGYVFPPKISASGAAVNLIFAAVVLIKLVIGIARMFLAHEPKPLQRLFARENLGRIIVTVVALQLFVMAGSSFAALKAGIPKAVPFWLDVPLANAEHQIFGLHPWQISHALLGWATPVIDAVYATFVPFETTGFVIVLCARPSAWKSRALLTIVLAWFVMGVLCAYLLSSAGPVFYDRVFGGNTFAGLTQMVGHDAPLTARVSEFLWEAHSQDREVMLNGISAMPSMHVAGALWIALVLGRTRIAPLGWAYYALIWIGSVHLGWHYLSDGLAGTVGILVLWRIAPRLLFKPYRTRVDAECAQPS
jgi:hypothetical protein